MQDALNGVPRPLSHRLRPRYPLWRSTLCEPNSPEPRPRPKGELARRAESARDVSEITEEGARWPDGTMLRADVILWCTGFRSSLDHLAPLMLREPDGGIVMTGRLATQVAKDPRVHLVGYGPSASTIGANRAGRAAAQELMPYLGLPERAAAPRPR